MEPQNTNLIHITATNSAVTENRNCSWTRISIFS